jgi:uncharacterized protein
MWGELLILLDEGRYILAKLQDDIKLHSRLTKSGIMEALDNLDASNYFLDNDNIENFINLANEGNGKAYEGIKIAEKRNATVSVTVTDDGLLAHMIVTGAYGGRGLRGPELVQALSAEHVIKGINKLALKKVLAVSCTLEPGVEYTQVVAQGKKPRQGKDARFIPLVDDVTKQVLAPQPKSNSSKVDMRNLGETITVGVNDPVLRLKPATKGIPGYTVKGEPLLPIPGKEFMLKEGKGTALSPEDTNLLIATIAGMPIIKDNTVNIENALCLKSVGVGTGHVKFKGCLVVTGDIEPGMIVRATGDITVGGFIESADVQAKGDVLVKKGIIGHTVSDGEPKSCVVKSGGSIKANYAQYAELQSQADIHLYMHSLGNYIKCGGDVAVIDSKMQRGTLSGGTAKIGGKLLCYDLGVEGDTPTDVEAFAKYSALKTRLDQLREQYNLCQERVMEVVRKEIEFRKKPKSERSDDEALDIEQQKTEANNGMSAAKSSLNIFSADFEELLNQNTIEVKHQVYTHVTVRFGDEKIIVKNEHGASVFTFNQYEISCKSSMLESDMLDKES